MSCHVANEESSHERGVLFFLARNVLPHGRVICAQRDDDAFDGERQGVCACWSLR